MPADQEDGCILDRLLKDIKRGASLRRTGAARSTGRQRAIRNRPLRIPETEGRERTGIPERRERTRIPEGRERTLPVFPRPGSSTDC